MATAIHPSPAVSKQARLNLRLNSGIKERIEQAAAIAGLTVNAFVQQAAEEKSEAVLDKYFRICLDNKARDRFFALLDAPPAPTQEALEAAAEYNKGREVNGRYTFEL